MPNNNQTPHHRESGVTVLEIAIITAVVSGLVVGVLALLSTALQTLNLARQTDAAVLIAQGELDALRNYRDGIAWENDDPANEYDGLGILSLGASYHMEQSGDTPPKWKTASGTELVGEYTKKFELSAVQRDGSDNIVSSGGVIDDNTVKAMVTVSWDDDGVVREASLSTYFTNWNE